MIQTSPATGTEAGRVIATLERGADRWTVKERHDYPADVARLRKNLLALAEARVIEEKTSDPAYYSRLGVQDMNAAKARGMRLTLAGSKQPIDVIIGLPGPGGSDSTYMRRVGEAQSWLVSGRFDIGKTTGEWLSRSLMDIPASRVASITITHPGTEPLRITRHPDSADADSGDAGNINIQFDVTGIPKGRSLSYPGVTNGIAGALADLQLEDVQTRDSLGEAPGKPVVARFVTTDGLVVEATAWQLPQGTRFSFSASAGKPPQGSPDSAAQDAAKQASALNARFGGWVYTLPPFKAGQLTKNLKDLLAAP
ncbi:MAG: DUF4340 domain-containing protein [Gammaproteobacteria bacterium]